YCGARAPRRRWRRRARRRGRSARWTKRCSSSRTSIRSRDRRSPAEAGAPSRLEARGEAETGEEPIGVEEEGQALDAIAALDGDERPRQERSRLRIGLVLTEGRTAARPGGQKPRAAAGRAASQHP